MAMAHTLSCLGLYVVPDFLDANLCAILRNEMRASPTKAAMIVNSQNEQVVDAMMRQTDLALPSSEARAGVTSRLHALKPALESHFSIILTGCQPPEFLIYREGYHFAPHRDNERDESAPPWLRERRVSISLFLNGNGRESDSGSYSGGRLTFYGLLNGISNRSIGVSVTGKEGLLVAFRSDTLHAVQPITRSVRYSIVTWFM
jgi:predicted 2-oxoglutarate/Fe(II)-dependent dioxygenase YbiX